MMLKQEAKGQVLRKARANKDTARTQYNCGAIEKD